MNDLKSCPFCDGKGYIRTEWREGYQIGFVACERCGCQTSGVNTTPGWKEIVIKAWNKRADND